MTHPHNRSRRARQHPPVHHDFVRTPAIHDPRVRHMMRRFGGSPELNVVRAELALTISESWRARL